MNATHLSSPISYPKYPVFFLGTIILIVSSFCGLSSLKGQNTPPWPEEEAEALTRGPVHEAFASTISYNPEAGPLINKEPPAPIEEQPPELKPEGTNIIWLSGYWAWDDERNTYLWISGVWRDIPPGRQWIPGYWNSTDSGFQWISGYWATLSSTQPRYLSQPPSSLENGPNIAIPSVEYVWVPGVWVWQGRYVWRPGYWVRGRPDLSWTPDTYVYTPHGYIYVDGYWDYPVVRRGVLFAPVYWHKPVYARRSYYYRPSIVINLSIFSDCLFVRPRYRHYYFGDYYGPAYRQSGFYTSISFGSNRRGYDPIHRHQRWENRHDRNWEISARRTYEIRRGDQSARPPRSFAEQQTRKTQRNESQTASPVIATPLVEASRNNPGQKEFRKVSASENEKQMQEVRQARLDSVDRQKKESKIRPEKSLAEKQQEDLPLAPSREKKTNTSERSVGENAERTASDQQTLLGQDQIPLVEDNERQRKTPKVKNTETRKAFTEENRPGAQDESISKNPEKERRSDNVDPKLDPSQVSKTQAEQPTVPSEKEENPTVRQTSETNNGNEASRSEERLQRQAQKQQQRRTEQQAQKQAEQPQPIQTEQQAQKQDQQEQQPETSKQTQKQAEQPQQSQSEQQAEKQAKQEQPQSEKQAQEQTEQQQERQAEQQAQKQAQQEQRQAEKQAQKQAEQQQERQAEQQAQKQAQQEQRQAEQQAQKQPEQQQQRQAEQQAQKQAEQQQERQTEQQAQKQAQQEQRQAEQQAQRQAEQQQRQAEQQAQRQAEQQQQRQAEQQAQKQAEQQQQRQAEQQAQRQAEQQQQRQAEQQAQKQAEQEQRNSEREERKKPQKD